MTNRLNRREALGHLARCAGCALAVPALGGCTISRVFGGAGGDVAFDVSDATFAPLAEVGGAVPVDTGARKLMLIRVSEDEVVALDRICTHAVCDMAPGVDGTWDGEKLTCLCHFSEFSATGEVLKGPATRDLQRFTVEFDALAGTGTVYLQEPPEDPVLVIEPDAEGRVVVDFAAAPALATPGGLAAVDAGFRKMLLIRVDEESAAALQRLCTHAACDMAPHLSGRFQDGVLTCTCHDSRFDLSGAILQGPALLPLATYSATVEADRVVVRVSGP